MIDLNRGALRPWPVPAVMPRRSRLSRMTKTQKIVTGVGMFLAAAATVALAVGFGGRLRMQLA